MKLFMQTSLVRKWPFSPPLYVPACLFGMSKIAFSLDAMRQVFCCQSFMHDNLKTSTFADATVMAEMEKGQ